MTRPGRIDFQAIAAAALVSAERLVPNWLPQGHKNGTEWKSINPTRSDNKAGSFSVNLNSGQWADFATDDKGGDLISLYAYLFEGGDNGKAARALARELHLDLEPTDEPKTESQPSKSASPPKPEWRVITPVPDDAPPAPIAHSHRGKPVATWTYRDQQGRVLGHVYRFVTSDGGKEILPLTFAQKGNAKPAWSFRQWAEPRPLYGLDRLSDDPDRVVLIVEGEKCADYAHAQLATLYDVVTWPGGGNAVHKIDWSPLAGRQIIFWPDCDSQKDKRTLELLPEQKQPGIKAAERISVKLNALECRVQIVDVPKPGVLPNGWDVVDAGEGGDDLIVWLSKLRDPLLEDEPKAEPEPPTSAGAAEETPPAKTHDRPFIEGLIFKGNSIAPCLSNVVCILQQDKRWDGVIAEDLFATRIIKRKPLPMHDDDGAGEWSDIDTSRTVVWLSLVYGMTPGNDVVDRAVDVVARANAFHPVRDWIGSLEWDGTERIKHWLADYLGVKDSDYSRRVAKWFLVAMVARVYRPGVKFDTCLVLEGTQGLKKSSALRVLAGEWFSDTELDLANKDSMSAIRGKLLHEFAELGSIARTEATRQKSFLSRQIDEYRPTYGRREIRCPRQLVFAGTTNDWQWQKDPTGGRRFWPVEVTREISTDDLAQVREQLFAEAFVCFERGDRFWPTPEEQRRFFDPEQASRESEDAFEDAIHNWLDESTQEHFSLADVLTGPLKLDAARFTRDVQTRVGQILKKQGCKRIEKRNGVTRFLYVLPDWSKFQQAQQAKAVGDSDGEVPI